MIDLVVVVDILQDSCNTLQTHTSVYEGLGNGSDPSEDRLYWYKQGSKSQYTDRGRSSLLPGGLENPVHDHKNFCAYQATWPSVTLPKVPRQDAKVYRSTNLINPYWQPRHRCDVPLPKDVLWQFKSIGRNSHAN